MSHCITASTLTCRHCLKGLLASCLINAQPLLAHSPAADDNSLIGCTSHDLTDDWSQPVPILLIAYAHFSARLGAFFYQTSLYDNSVPLDNTTPIYLINLRWKLGLGLRLDLSCTILAFFTENKESEHLSCLSTPSLRHKESEHLSCLSTPSLRLTWISSISYKKHSQR